MASLWRIVAACVFCAGAFDVERSIYKAADPSRGGHSVTATLYLAKDNPNPAPVVAFAHGFGLSSDAYPLARKLAEEQGYVVLLPHNLGVVPSTTNLALDQIFLLARAVNESSSVASPLYGRVSKHTVLAGHSLGGGSTLLAADSKLAAAYPPPAAIFTVSLGTYTIPNALNSAPKIPSEIPALLMTATQDCVDPPQKNSLPVFQSMQSQCVFVPSVVGGSHCQYAASSLGCTTTERLCGAHPNISREEQVDAALHVILPFLDAAFDATAEKWQAYNAALETSIAAGNITLLAHRSDGCVQPGLLSQRAHDDLDTDFARACQRQVGHAAKGNLSITLINASSTQFLSTKPSLRADESMENVNVTMLMHHEDTAPFSHSLGLKMKSGQAINPAAPVDDVSCQQLHNASLASALSMLTPSQRQAYGKSTKRLVFGSDDVYHTGLWVAFAKLQVREDEHHVQVVAPRFFSSTKVPGEWGGVLYCRLLPPTAMRDWIAAQIPSVHQAQAMVI